MIYIPHTVTLLSDKSGVGSMEGQVQDPIIIPKIAQVVDVGISSTPNNMLQPLDASNIVDDR